MDEKKEGERERKREREREREKRECKYINVKCLAGKGRHSNIPLKSGNTSGSGLSLIFCSKRSFLLRNRITEVSRNHLLLRIELKSRKASSIRFYRRNNQLKLTS